MRSKERLLRVRKEWRRWARVLEVPVWERKKSFGFDFDGERVELGLGFSRFLRRRRDLWSK